MSNRTRKRRNQPRSATKWVAHTSPLDNAIERAAGVIMHTVSAGYDEEYALAKAAEREPQLDESEMRQALDWALAARRFCDLINESDGSHTIQQIIDMSGMPTE